MPLRLLSYLAFIGLGAVTLGTLIAVLHAIAIGRRRRAAAMFGAWLGAAGIYCLLLAGVSVASREVVLEPGREKRFCALDCDLAYSVASVHSAAPVVSRGHDLIVTLRARSDARAAIMNPSNFSAWLVTAEGRRIDPLELPAPAETGTLEPGEAKPIELRFEVADGTRIEGLEVAEGGWPTRLLIGDENSFMHRKVLLRLPEPTDAVAEGPSFRH